MATPPVRVHDENIDDFLNDLSVEATFPGLREIMKFADTHKTPLAGAIGDLRPDIPSNVPLDLDLATLPSEVARASKIIRLLLGIIKDKPEFKRARSLLPEDLQQKLDDFLNGKPLSDILPDERSEFAAQHPEAANDASAPLGAPALEHFTALCEKLGAGLLGDGVKEATEASFENWGQTVQNTPGQTRVPQSKQDVVNLVKDAITNNKRIRVAGYRHTWTDLYSQDKQDFISILDPTLVTTLPNFTAIECDPDYGNNDLKQIELAVDPGNPNVAYIKLGAAVTNEDFRRWAIRPTNGNSKWTLPIQVIMVEITFGGSNGPICHGAGIKTTTLSDLVVEVEYVNANGELKQLSDPELLRAAAGCFGLLGVVTSITLKLDAMTAAMFDPRTEDLLLAIPPPQGYYDKLPKELQKRYKKISSQDLEKARQTFIDTAENKYYSEWFWFPYQENAFINAWDNSTDTSNMKNYPGKLEVFLQWLFNWGGGILNDLDIFTILPPTWQACVMGTMAMWTMPHSPHKTQLINALHFRRGIQNMRVGDFEVEIPIPAIEKSGSPTQTRNWELVQQAWWDGIIAIYNDKKNVSARIALEMRVTGDSTVIMAPQRGNSLGTASIEVITSMPAVRDKRGIWSGFKQTLADIWLNYEDADGQKLRVRPHWAKEWSGTKAFGQDWVEYLRETHYKEEIPEFIATLKKIGERDGWTLKDLQTRFSNQFLDKLIYGNLN